MISYFFCNISQIFALHNVYIHVYITEFLYETFSYIRLYVEMNFIDLAKKYIIIIIIIALDNAPYKMLHKLKSACFIRKKQLWTSASSNVSQKSLD